MIILFNNQASEQCDNVVLRMGGIVTSLGSYPSTYRSVTDIRDTGLPHTCSIMFKKDGRGMKGHTG